MTALAAGALLLPAEPAPAGVASFSANSGALTYTDASEIANDVVFEASGSGAIVRDGAGVTAGEGCLAVDARAVRCAPDAYVFELHADTGLGDDRVRIVTDAASELTYADVVLGAGDDAFQADSRIVADVDGGDGADDLAATGRMLFGGPGNDVIRAAGFGPDTALLIGGPGDDRLLGGGAAQVLAGGSGADELSGGGGRDTLDGDGSDRLPQISGAQYPPELDRHPAALPGDDRIDGGPGSDTLDELTRRDDLRIDLGRGRARGHTDHDRLRSLERVLGGLGNDVIRGSDGDDSLGGGSGVDAGAGPRDGGRDVLLGLGGDDELEGSGEDRMSGGPGNDELGSPGPRSSCGSGTDLVDGDRSRLPPRDCERMFLGEVDVDPFHAIVHAGALEVPILAHNDAGGGATSWTVRAGWNGRGAILGRREGSPNRRDRLLVIVLNARGRRYIAGGGRRVTVSEHWSAGEPDTDDDDTGPGALIISSVR